MTSTESDSYALNKSKRPPLPSKSVKASPSTAKLWLKQQQEKVQPNHLNPFQIHLRIHPHLNTPPLLNYSKNDQPKRK